MFYLLFRADILRTGILGEISSDYKDASFVKMTLLKLS